MGSSYCQCSDSIKKAASIKIEPQPDSCLFKESRNSLSSNQLSICQESTNFLFSKQVSINSNNLKLSSITYKPTKFQNTQISKPAITRRHSDTFKTTIYIETINNDLKKLSISERTDQIRKPYKELPKKSRQRYESTIMSPILISEHLIHDKETIQKDIAPIITISTPLSDRQLQLIRELLSNEDLITPRMDETTINSIINIIDYIRVRKNVVLYTFDNKIDNIYYIIEKGKMIYAVDNNENVLRKYNGIGTKALRTHSKESCELKTVDRCYIFRLPVEKYKALLKKYTEKESEHKYQVLKECILFSFLESSVLRKLATKSTMIRFKMRKAIIKEGMRTTSLYVITEGSVIMVKNEIIIGYLFQGDIFGEIFLFAQMDSSCGYMAESETTLIEIPYEVLYKLLGDKALNTILFGVINSSIQKCEYLNKHLTGDRLLPVFEAFEIKIILNGPVTNNKSKRIFIPISGKFKKTHENLTPKNKLDTQKKLEIFNCQDVIKGELHISSILSSKANEIIFSDQCIILKANWVEITKKIKSLSQQNILISDLINTIKNISFLNHLSELKLFLIADALKIKKYKDGQLILVNGPKSDYFFIIKSGSVKVIISNKEIRSLTEGNYFGDISSSAKDYPKTVNFTAKGNVECYTLDKEDYNEIIDNDSLFTKPFNTLFDSKDKTTLDSLYYIKELGYGTYGKVYLVHNSESLLALKTADIQAMSSQKVLAGYYLNEKKIMLSMNHPFIIKLFKTFKTRDYIFFILEYVNGVTLREYIDQRGKETFRLTNQIYFYGGILFIVLNYLQKQRIIHRDIKPENVMIDSKGYLKVIDFGISKDLSGKNSTHTMFGTPHYMAPEIILGKKYSFAVDYWSVGVILYELFYGKYPFGTDNTDNKMIFKEITEKKVVFPTDPQHKNLNLLLKQLLCKTPSNRIDSFDQIKNHPFFQSFNFDSINDMSVKPIFIPPTQETISLKTNESDQFIWFMKNNLIFSSIDCLNSINKHQEKDYFSDF